MSAIVKKEGLSPLQKFNQELEVSKENIRKALPASINVDRFISAMKTAVQTTPSLASCNRQSLWVAIGKCAADGLMPDGREAAIIAYGQTATYQSMTYGVIKRIKNSGQYSTVLAEAVFPEDKWTYYIDEKGKHYRHEPDMSAERTDDRILFVYSVIVEKDSGEINMDVMNRAEVEKTRLTASKAANGPGWAKWWGEMAKKTVLRRLSKRVSMTSEFDKFVKSFDEDMGVKLADPKPSSSTGEDFAFESFGSPIEVESSPVEEKDEEPKEWELEASKAEAARIVK